MTAYDGDPSAVHHEILLALVAELGSRDPALTAGLLARLRRIKVLIEESGPDPVMDRAIELVASLTPTPPETPAEP